MAAIVAATDPGSTRVVYAMVAGLVVIGVLLVAVGVWLIRQTRVDPPMLGPLERMGERDWLKKDGPSQRRLLDEVRPEGALPLRVEPDPPRLDAAFDHPPPPASLSDLGPGVGEPRSPTPRDAPRPELDAPTDDGPETPTEAEGDDAPDADDPPDLAEAPADAGAEADDADVGGAVAERGGEATDLDRPTPEISW